MTIIFYGNVFYKILFFLTLICRGFGAIGPFVDMIYRMCAGDMSRFFIIYIIYVVGLAQGETPSTAICNVYLPVFGVTTGTN